MDRKIQRFHSSVWRFPPASIKEISRPPSGARAFRVHLKPPSGLRKRPEPVLVNELPVGFKVTPWTERKTEACPARPPVHRLWGQSRLPRAAVVEAALKRPRQWLNLPW